MDKAFLTATAIPLMGLAGAIAYKFRPLEWQKGDGKKVNCRPDKQLRTCFDMTGTLVSVPSRKGCKMDTGSEQVAAHVKQLQVRAVPLACAAGV